MRYGSRVNWSNSGKGVAPSPTPWCSSYRKGRLRVTLDWEELQSKYSRFHWQGCTYDEFYFSLSLSLYIYIYIYINGFCKLQIVCICFKGNIASNFAFCYIWLGVLLSLFILPFNNFVSYHSCNLLNFLFRCSTRPHEWGTQWESNSLFFWADSWRYCITRPTRGKGGASP